MAGMSKATGRSVPLKSALQAQRALEFGLEAVFDIADGALQVVAAQRGTVGFGDDDAVHVVTSL